MDAWLTRSRSGARAQQTERPRTLDVWAARGTLIRKRKYLPQLLTDLVALPALANVHWFSRGPRSKAGHPRHPLYVRADAFLDAFDVGAYLADL